MGSLPIDPMVRSVIVDPVDPKRVYAAGAAGLFLSDDAGLTWRPASGEWSSDPVGLSLDPTSPNRLFVILSDGSLWGSENAGSNWKPLGAGAEGNE